MGNGLRQEQVGPERVTPEVLRRIRRHIHNLGSPDETTAIRAERHLIRYGSRALGPLIEAIAEANPQVRIRAAWALGHIGDPRALNALMALAHHPNQEVAYEAIMALGLLGDPRAIEPLVRCVREKASQDEGVMASAAAMALVRIGKPAVEPLVRLLDEGDLEARIMAASALGNIGDEEAVLPLMAFMDDPNPWVRVAGIEALGEIGGVRSLALIEGYVEDPNPDVRDAATFWCKEILATLPEAPGKANGLRTMAAVAGR